MLQDLTLRTLYITRCDAFVISEEGDDLPPGTYLRREYVGAPGVVLFLYFAIISVVWYAVLLALVAWARGAAPLWGVWGSTLILALCATIRLSLKARERAGELAKWEESVGRQSTAGRLLAVGVGIALGALSGTVLRLSLPSLVPATSWPIAIAGVAAYEGFQMAIKIGRVPTEVDDVEVLSQLIRVEGRQGVIVKRTSGTLATPRGSPQ